MDEQNTVASAPQEELTEEELRRIEHNARRFEPLDPWQYFWTSLLYMVPGVGLVAMILQAINARNVNRICFARSRLILLAVVVTIFILIIMLLYFTNSLHSVIYILKLAYKAIAEELSHRIRIF